MRVLTYTKGLDDVDEFFQMVRESLVSNSCCKLIMEPGDATRYEIWLALDGKELMVAKTNGSCGVSTFNLGGNYTPAAVQAGWNWANPYTLGLIAEIINRCACRVPDFTCYDFVKGRYTFE